MPHKSHWKAPRLLKREAHKLAFDQGHTVPPFHKTDRGPRRLAHEGGGRYASQCLDCGREVRIAACPRAGELHISGPALSHRCRLPVTSREAS